MVFSPIIIYPIINQEGLLREIESKQGQLMMLCTTFDHPKRVKHSNFKFPVLITLCTALEPFLCPCTPMSHLWPLYPLMSIHITCTPLWPLAQMLAHPCLTCTPLALCLTLVSPWTTLHTICLPLVPPSTLLCTPCIPFAI